MITGVVILGSIGLLLFLIILGFFQKLLQNNESGLLHLLMTLMFICWLPIPIAVYAKLSSYDFMLIGTLFGFLASLLFIFTMILQAGHLSFSAQQQKEDEKLWETNDRWMMQGMLGGPVELLAGLLKSIWISFVTVCFWLQGDIIFFFIGILLSLFTVIYFVMLIDSCMVNKVKLFHKLKINFIVINIETIVGYSMLTVWLLRF